MWWVAGWHLKTVLFLDETFDVFLSLKCWLPVLRAEQNLAISYLLYPWLWCQFCFVLLATTLTTNTAHNCIQIQKRNFRVFQLYFLSACVTLLLFVYKVINVRTFFAFHLKWIGAAGKEFMGCCYICLLADLIQ